MGNRTSLAFDDYCEFEANNCLPITWLALFESDNYLTEERETGGDQFVFSGYRTNRELATQRIENAIIAIKKNSGVWPYFRPLELLRNELELCPAKGIVELNATQFSDTASTFEERTIQAIAKFTSVIGSFNDDEVSDTKILDQLIQDFCLGNISSVRNLNSEEKMFVLIGSYYGSKEREKLYSLNYFNDDYWKLE